MTRYFVGSFIQILIFFTSVCAQERTFSTIEEAVNFHVEGLTSSISRYDNLIVLIELDSSVNLPERALKVDYFLDAKLLNKRDKNFVVKFTLSSTKESIQIHAINFQIIKQSRKKIKWVNLGNGQRYRVNNSS